MNPIKHFRTIYPSNECSASIVGEANGKAIVYAEFIDGGFYFVVGENFVSCAYNTYERAEAEA